MEAYQGMQTAGGYGNSSVTKKKSTSSCGPGSPEKMALRQGARAIAMTGTSAAGHSGQFSPTPERQGALLAAQALQREGALSDAELEYGSAPPG